jgi:hypothetical protein
MRDKQNIPEKDIENLIKRSVLLEPPGDMEDNIMNKIYAKGKKYEIQSPLTKWMPKIIFGFLAAIFIYFMVFPVKFQFFSKMNSAIDMNKFRLVDPGIYDLGPSQPYLLMSIIVFAVAVWMIILFNLPKKDSPNRFI